jgi:hypothetical protein
MAEKMPRRMRGKSGKSLELIGAAYKILAEMQPAACDGPSGLLSPLY